MEAAIKQILERIDLACQRCSRKSDEVKLIAVTKTVPVSAIKQAYQFGLRSFGENIAQEFRDKVSQFPDDVEWHFIGHLQTNKIKYVAPKMKLLHSADSLHLSQALSQYAVRNEMTLDILLQVNTSYEASKFGFDPDTVEENFGRINELPGLAIKGLMTIGPFSDEEADIRKSFRLLRKLQESLRSSFTKASTSILSMGMTHDFEIAIEEGSNMVRIGTAIFGSRGRTCEVNTFGNKKAAI